MKRMIESEDEDAGCFVGGCKDCSKQETKVEEVKLFKDSLSMTESASPSTLEIVPSLSSSSGLVSTMLPQLSKVR